MTKIMTDETAAEIDAVRALVHGALVHTGEYQAVNVADKLVARGWPKKPMSMSDKMEMADWLCNKVAADFFTMMTRQEVAQREHP